MPSDGAVVEYRPFLVKEEKVLLMAVESKDEKEMIKALKKVIVACVETEGFDADGRPLFDLEYLFLKLRANSVGENVTPVIRPADCTTSVEVEIDLSEVECVKNKKHTSQIVLVEADGKNQEELGVSMKYPTLKNAMNMPKGKNAEDPEIAFGIITECIDYIYQGEDVFSSKDHTKKQLEEFVDSLTQNQFQAITEFFETMPKLSHEVEYFNPCTQEKERTTLTGLQDFFQSASDTTT
tara:strand:+ start:155 stop:868 length:714 start_codon:yes stop_codon:yes gene_type:complete